MKNKMLLLIISSIMALLGLSLVQGTLIYNTFKLKQDDFFQETRDQIFHIENSIKIDSIYDNWFQNLEPNLVDYKNNRIPKEFILKSLEEDAILKNNAFSMYYNQELNALDLGYKVHYKKELKSIIIIEGDLLDTIYDSAKDKAISLFGSPFQDTESATINSSRQFTEHEHVKQTDSIISIEKFNLELKTKNVMYIEGSSTIIFGRMYILLTVSVLIFLFVIALFYYSIKNLISHKKISAVKTDFINNITHELKTPLATLNIASKSLRSPIIKENIAAFDNTLAIVDRQNDRLQKLIDQVLTNSLGSNELILSKSQVIDTVYFDDLIADFKLSMQHQNITIINAIYKPDIMLRIDDFHFTTAILNIMENAVKYGTEETEITITTVIENNYYKINIEDNGIGIKPKELPYIFDKFYRVNNGDVHEVKGLGLGMYYTKEIIKAHKGYITVTSQIEKGSIFTIKLPLN